MGEWGISYIIKGDNEKLKMLADKVALMLDTENAENVTMAGNKFDDVRVLDSGVVSFDLHKEQLIIANRNDRDNVSGTNEKITQAVEQAVKELGV